MTDITELTQEAARESGSILIIVAARMARREFFTPLHALCEAGKRVVSTRALRDAVEHAEERMVSQVPKIVDGHDRLTKKLKEAESRNAELVEALESEKRICATWRKTAEANSEKLEKAQTINAAAEKLVRCKGRYHSEQNYRALAALFGVNTPDLPPLDDESRAVTVENLQESAYRAGLTAGWNLGLANNNDGFNKCLAAHAAGIKVEAE
ncbi:hypothetical protein [Klebsiella pneumoniae]|uniref:hypothetical protein n=1 Tax=Klebsiella pneumoniae TaxID=573 RepID=UPI0037BE3BF2